MTVAFAPVGLISGVDGVDHLGHMSPIQQFPLDQLTPDCQINCNGAKLKPEKYVTQAVTRCMTWLKAHSWHSWLWGNSNHQICQEPQLLQLEKSLT